MAVLNIGDDVAIDSKYLTSVMWSERVNVSEPKETAVQGVVVAYQTEAGRSGELRVPCDRSVFEKIRDEWRAAAP